MEQRPTAYLTILVRAWPEWNGLRIVILSRTDEDEIVRRTASAIDDALAKIGAELERLAHNGP